MLQQKIKKQVGNYVVTPLSHPAASGLFVASVSIRRGVYDRIFSFVPQFASEGGAYINGQNIRVDGGLMRSV